MSVNPPGAPPRRKDLPASVDIRTQTILLIHPERNPTRYVPFDQVNTYKFQPDSATVSEVNAWWLADAAWVAYLQSEQAVSAAYAPTGLQARLFSIDDTDFTVASNGQFAIVAFRGTQPDKWRDILSDATWLPSAWDAGHVHRGFADAFEGAWTGELRDWVRALPARCPVWVTGHSLGAALATLAAFRIAGEGPRRPTRVCSFGSPLVGNQVFTGTFNQLFHDGTSLRYVNDFDVVTRVPPEEFAFPFGRFAHVDTLRWINRDGAVERSVQTQSRFFRDVFDSGLFLLDTIERAQTTDLPLPAALRDHTPVHYAILAWNDFVSASSTPA